MNIGSIFVALGFKANTRELNSFNSGIKNLKTNLVLTTAAFSGAVYGFKTFVDNAVNSSSSLINFNKQTGLSIERLNQFAQVGQNLSLGLDVNNITADILNLEKTIARVKLGQGSIRPFQMLGVNIQGQNAFGVIEQLRNSVKNLSDINATILLEDLGLNPNFLQILKLSNAEFDKLAKNNFLKTNQAKIIEQLGLKMRTLTTTFVNFKNQAIVKLAPYLIEAIKGISNFITRIERIIDVGSKFIDSISGMEKGLKFLAIGFGALTLATRPFLLGLSAIFLLLDDIAVWKIGGNSLFGDFYTTLSNIPNIGDILGIGAVIIGIGTLTKSVKTLLSAINPVVKAFAVISIATSGIKFLTGIPNIVPTNESQVLQNVGWAKEGGKYLTDGLRNLGDGFRNLFKLNNNEIPALKLNNNEIPALKSTEKDYIKSISSQSKVSNNNVSVTINAQTNDPQEIANEVNKAIEDLLKPSINNLNEIY